MHRSQLLPILLSLLTGCASAGATRLAGGEQVSSDGAPLELADVWLKHPATVLVWWSSTCPCVARYRDRVRDIAAAYAGRQVAFYFVASNADDGPTTLARAADEPLPILLDEGGALARTLGVISTPSVVVLDQQGAVRFLGWLDNEHEPGDPDREPWLAAALDDLLAGRGGARKTPVFGCTVTRSLSERKTCHSPAPAVKEVTHCGGK